ncbi:MAG: dihydroorotate dehydrogenase electron transfer subunit [Lentisphaerae bacterium]|jgi:dihydroorotate dehydrogenase electron transfer subunit|nr:dihydroorotate dehydrogenase electron transfer subunit [Lentisphaerota bacterium]
MVVYDAIVKRQSQLTAQYYQLILEAPAVAEQARPGQFVHVKVNGLDDAALRRPFSIYNAADGMLAIVYKTVGRGTALLPLLRVGDVLSVIGPLGNGFPEVSADCVPLAIGGGYGVAPLSFLARKSGRRGTLLVGARTENDLLCLDDFEELGWDVMVTTQDGSQGAQGVVTDLLDGWLAKHKDVVPEVFACGPSGMLQAVGERALGAGIKAWLSLDRRMICGVGACLACVQQLRRPDGSEWTGRVCHDGPVFEAREVIW